MSEAVDLRALLLKYAQHVMNMEGSHFLHKSERRYGGFSEAEDKVLEEVERQVDDDWRRENVKASA